jgi:hypothetical protein
MSDLSWTRFKAGEANWSFAVEEPATGFFTASKRAFLRSYSRRARAEKILEELLSTEFLPLVLRHGHGRGHLLQMILDVAEQIADEGEAYDKDLSNPQFILLLLILADKVPTPSQFADLWSFFDTPDSTPEKAEADYFRLEAALHKSDEWSLRELALRSGFLLERIDEELAFKESFSRDELCASILSNYKQLNKNILNDDFESAGQDHLNRRFRYAPRSGKGGVHKQVKLTLHEDLLPVVKEAVGSGNRNAWIEQAIIEKLERDGFQFEAPDYSEPSPQG